MLSLPSECTWLPDPVVGALFAGDADRLLAALVHVEGNRKDLDLLAYGLIMSSPGGADLSFQVQSLARVLEIGGNPNAVHEQKCLLAWACTKSSIDLAKVLLQHGALVNEPNSTRTSPLVCAIEQENRPLVKLLLDHAANPNAIDDRGRPVAFHAMLGQRQRLLPDLRAAGADLNARGEHGESVVHAWVDAALHLQRGMIPRDDRTLLKLVRWGVDPSVADHEGITPQQLAAKRNAPVVAAALARAEAQFQAQVLAGQTQGARASAKRPRL